jgi:hypothetical protein
MKVYYDSSDKELVIEATSRRERNELSEIDRELNGDSGLQGNYVLVLQGVRFDSRRKGAERITFYADETREPGVNYWKRRMARLTGG